MLGTHRIIVAIHNVFHFIVVLRLCMFESFQGLVQVTPANVMIWIALKVIGLACIGTGGKPQVMTTQGVAYHSRHGGKDKRRPDDMCNEHPNIALVLSILTRMVARQMIERSLQQASPDQTYDISGAAELGCQAEKDCEAVFCVGFQGRLVRSTGLWVDSCRVLVCSGVMDQAQ